MNEIITKKRTVYSDTIKTENDIFKRNVTSKEERERQRERGGAWGKVTCNSGCHPQHEGLWVCNVGAVRGNMNFTSGFGWARHYRWGYMICNWRGKRYEQPQWIIGQFVSQRSPSHEYGICSLLGTPTYSSVAIKGAKLTTVRNEDAQRGLYAQPSGILTVVHERVTQKSKGKFVSERATRWRSWLRHWASSWKVAGSIPDVVTGILHWRDPCGRTMALWLTQPLTEMSTRNVSWEVKTTGA